MVGERCLTACITYRTEPSSILYVLGNPDPVRCHRMQASLQLVHYYLEERCALELGSGNGAFPLSLKIAPLLTYYLSQ